MKIEIEEDDSSRYWGIWVKGQTWLSDGSFRIFVFPSPKLANVQHDLVVRMGDFSDEELEVKEIN